ncbi:MAG: CatA-like O-acetyltransferase, partial [bacterium]|nr:CatA-like O-acetyltransferase [bacterium]
MIKYHKLNMNEYNRKQQFDYFNSMPYPYVGLTVNVDITDFLQQMKQKQHPFFLSFLYAVTRAANAIPEFRQRIVDEEIMEYEKCISSYTVALEDHSYCYCSVDCDMPFEKFLPYARKAQESAKLQASLDDGEDALSLYFISTVTNLSYTAIVQPVPQPADSNPRITWGRYFAQEGRTLIPVSLLCNHA